MRSSPLSALYLLLFLCAVTPCSSETLRINSTPPGASVELNGVASGTTPFEKNFPGGYFHRTHTAIGQRLEHPMIARLSLPGYVTKELALTEGPMEWIDLHGHNHGQFWVFKADEFAVNLELISTVFRGGPPAAIAPDGSGRSASRNCLWKNW